VKKKASDSVYPSNWILFSTPGITKREYFAGIAIQGLLASGAGEFRRQLEGQSSGRASDTAEVTKLAWEIADAMIAAGNEDSGDTPSTSQHRDAPEQQRSWSRQEMPVSRWLGIDDSPPTGRGSENDR